jgi:hypothetical protein
MIKKIGCSYWAANLFNHDNSIYSVVFNITRQYNANYRLATRQRCRPMATDAFFWSDYLGRDCALKAFQYARADDPDALLFINDYNLYQK